MHEGDDDRQYVVVVNDEEQYSVWPTDTPPPAGWDALATTGSKALCLQHIGEIWTDMRPLSLRRWLGQGPTDLT